jgi:peroxiredoxin
MGSPQPGERCPDFQLLDIRGRAWSASAARGHWVLLHFTATWCPFCDSELSRLGGLATALAPRGVEVVVVDIEEDPSKWHAYATDRLPASVVALSDFTGRTAARFAPPGAQPSFEDRAQAVLDATLIVDPDGVIRLFLLPDSAHFDPTFGAVRREIEGLAAPPILAVEATPTAASAGEHVDLHIGLVVAPGYHVMSDRPSRPTYVPTRVDIAGEDGVEVAGPPSYPPARGFAVAGRDIATFEESVDVVVPLAIAKGSASGPRTLKGQVRYQACSATRCLFPSSRAFEATVVVGDGLRP